jgi:hypothetical protein
MKITAIITGAMLFVASTLTGQNASDQLFEKYSGQDGFTSVHITQYMFQLFADLDTDEELSEFMELASSIDRIKILTGEGDSLNPTRGSVLYKDAMKMLPIKEYQELMEVRDGDQTVHMLIKEEGKTISEFLMLVFEEEETAIISITGRIDLNQLARLSKQMNIDGLEGLQEIEELDED